MALFGLRVYKHCVPPGLKTGTRIDSYENFRDTSLTHRLAQHYLRGRAGCRRSGRVGLSQTGNLQ